MMGSQHLETQMAGTALFASICEREDAMGGGDVMGGGLARKSMSPSQRCSRRNSDVPPMQVFLNFCV